MEYGNVSLNLYIPVAEDGDVTDVATAFQNAVAGVKWPRGTMLGACQFSAPPRKKKANSV